MEDFTQKLKSKFGKAKVGAEKYSKLAAEKTSSVISRAKISVAISEAEKKIKDIKAEIGEYVYKEFRAGTEFPEDLNAKCAELEALEEEIAELKESMAELKDSIICGSCGEYNPKENEFCGKCGNKIK